MPRGTSSQAAVCLIAVETLKGVEYYTLEYFTSNEVSHVTSLLEYFFFARQESRNENQDKKASRYIQMES